MPRPAIETINFGSDENIFCSQLADVFSREPAMGEAQAADWVEQQIGEPSAMLPDGFRLLGQIPQSAPLVHVRGLALGDDLPPTPNKIALPSEAQAQTWQVAHMAVASSVGKIFGCDHTRYGRLVHDVFSLEDTGSNAGYSYGHQKGLKFHVDGAMDPENAPPYFSMQCMRNREQIPTIFSTVSRADLDAKAWELLHDPVWTIRFNAKAPQDTDVKDVPIIEATADGELHRINYYADTERLRLNDVPQRDTLRYLTAMHGLTTALTHNVVALPLQPGEVIVVKNYSVVHGRPGTTQPIGERGTRRWLTRHWLTSSPEQVARIQQSVDRVLISARSPAQSTEPR